MCNESWSTSRGSYIGYMLEYNFSSNSNSTLLVWHLWQKPFTIFFRQLEIKSLRRIQTRNNCLNPNRFGWVEYWKVLTFIIYLLIFSCFSNPTFRTTSLLFIVFCTTNRTDDLIIDIIFFNIGNEQFNYYNNNNWNCN